MMTLFAFSLYFSALLAIGIIFHRKQTSAAEFLVANRSLNFWVTALSAHASDMSSWLFMAFPSAVYLSGMDQLWTAFGLVLGMFLTWQFVAVRLRVQTEKLEAYTLSMFFEKRFNDSSGVLSFITAVMILIFLTSYISSGLIAMGLLLESLFGMNYYLGLSIASCVVVSYTVLGGFLTVAYTDLFQGMFLFVVILLVPFVALEQISGGWQQIFAAMSAKGVSLALLPDTSWQSIVGAISLALGWGLGYFGQPHIITKFLGIKNPKDLRKGKYLGISWQIVVLTAAAFVGIIGISFFEQPLANPQLVFIEMVQRLFTPFFASLILCGILAATVSTMDSQILVCSSVIGEDLWKRLFNKTASSQQIVMVSRSAVVLVALVALVLAFDRNATILAVVLYAWSGLGSAFGPLVLMSLYSTTANRYGAIAGIIVGGVSVIVWEKCNLLLFSYALPPMIVGFPLSLATIYIVSKATAKLSGPAKSCG